MKIGNLSVGGEIYMKGGGEIEVNGCADFSKSSILLDSSNLTSNHFLFSSSNKTCTKLPSSIRGVSSGDCYSISSEERYFHQTQTIWLLFF